MPRKRTGDKPAEILNFIRERLRTNGYPPSIREIGSAVGLSSSSTVHGYLSRLEEEGFIRRDPTKPRAIEIVAEAPWRQKEMVPVPLVGRVTAGLPILAEENVEDTYPLPASLLGRGGEDLFMLTVSGESMIKAGIHNGDLLLVRPCDTAKNGDIVVALVNGEEATVKRFWREGQRILLKPENDAMEPLCPERVDILGHVVGLFRRF